MEETHIVHSPDADDIFMYMAVEFGWVRSFKYHHQAPDIQTLNGLALKNEFDATATSSVLYPFIAKDYALLHTAVSFDEDYGPKLIKKKDKILKRNFKVALSGANMMNALIFRIKYPEARIIYKNFSEIEKAVLNDEVNAGVLAHESILEFDTNLCVEFELWDIWLELVKEDLPLPLGGTVLRRSLPLSDAIKIGKDLTKAAFLAHHNRRILASMLLERGLIRVDEAKLGTYLNLYANHNSISMSETQLQALDMLFKLGYDCKFYGKILKTNDYLILSEYEQARNL